MLVIPQRFGGLVIPRVRRGAPIEVQFLSAPSNTSNLSTYTYSSVDLGDEAADRLIVVAAMADLSSGAITGCTIGGESATMINTPSVNSSRHTAMFYRRSPSGASANIVVTHSSSANRAGIGVWRIVNQTSDEPLDFDKDAGSDGAASVSVNAAKGGVVIAACMVNNNDGVVWSNATERFDNAVEGNVTMSGCDAIAADAGAYGISASFDSDSHALFAASWA